MLIAVRGKNNWPLTELLFQTIGIKLGLLLPGTRIAFGALCFDQCQRLTIVTPQHIINKTLALIIRHAFNHKFAVAWIIQIPTGLFKQQIDIEITRFSFRIIMMIRYCFIFALGGSDFNSKTLQLGIKIGPVTQHGFKGFVACFHLTLHASEFGESTFYDIRSTAELRGIKSQIAGRHALARIGARQPEA
ncbi:hypothetical protein D3C80_1145090 [compost metagenome]